MCSSDLLYRFTRRDALLTAVMAALAVCVIAFGGTGAAYTPVFTADSPTWALAAYAAFLLIPMILNGKEALLWHISRSKI